MNVCIYIVYINDFTIVSKIYITIYYMNSKNILDNPSGFEQQITDTKTNFNKLKDACHDIDSVFEALHIKVKKLNQFYNDFVKTNTSQLMIFGLDSFNFQNRMIANDISNMKQIKNLLFNRIYADYYKLYNIIISYIKSNLTQSKIYTTLMTANKQFPKYDYLDVSTFYDFGTSNDVFYEIINLVHQLYDYCKNLDTQLQNYTQKKDIGLNIDNFVHTHEYLIFSMKSQIKLYMNYISFFIRVHTKYLQRFITRLKIIHCQLMEDIKLDDVSYNYENTPSTIRKLSNYQDLSLYNAKQQGSKMLKKRISSNKNVIISNKESSTHSVDSGVIIRTELSPVERNEFKKILDHLGESSSELVRNGLTNLIETSDSENELLEGPITHNIHDVSETDDDSIVSNHYETESINDDSSLEDRNDVVTSIVEEMVDKISEDEEVNKN